jgi:hypothetical protein
VNHLYFTRVPNAMFAKMSGAWQTVGTLASTAGVTTFAIGGARGILDYASPYTFLTHAEGKLERIKARLQELSPKRREEIEIATRSESFNGSSLETLEKRLEEYVPLIDSVSSFRIQVHAGSF